MYTYIFYSIYTHTNPLLISYDSHKSSHYLIPLTQILSLFHITYTNPLIVSYHSNNQLLIKLAASRKTLDAGVMQISLAATIVCIHKIVAQQIAVGVVVMNRMCLSSELSGTLVTCVAESVLRVRGAPLVREAFIDMVMLVRCPMIVFLLRFFLLSCTLHSVPPLFVQTGISPKLKVVNHFLSALQCRPLSGLALFFVPALLHRLIGLRL